jgi:hypothetical protein
MQIRPLIFASWCPESTTFRVLLQLALQRKLGWNLKFRHTPSHLTSLPHTRCHPLVKTILLLKFQRSYVKAQMHFGTKKPVPRLDVGHFTIGQLQSLRGKRMSFLPRFSSMTTSHASRAVSAIASATPIETCRSNHDVQKSKNNQQQVFAGGHPPNY